MRFYATLFAHRSYDSSSLFSSQRTDTIILFMVLTPTSKMCPVYT